MLRYLTTGLLLRLMLQVLCYSLQPCVSQQQYNINSTQHVVKKLRDLVKTIYLYDSSIPCCCFFAVSDRRHQNKAKQQYGTPVAPCHTLFCTRVLTYRLTNYLADVFV